MAGVGQSGIYTTNVIGDLRPKMMCIQMYPHLLKGPQDWTIILTSGNVNVENYAGSCPAISIEPSGYLNFGSGENIVATQRASRTIPFLFLPKNSTVSGITTNISVFNMKLWIDDKTTFSGFPKQPYIQMLPSGTWVQNLTLASGEYGAYEVPTSLPDNPNIMRIDGAPWLSGVGRERTQIIYSSIIMEPGTYETGRYGTSGDFHWRFTYDWSDEDAHIHVGLGSGTHSDY